MFVGTEAVNSDIHQDIAEDSEDEQAERSVIQLCLAHGSSFFLKSGGISRKEHAESNEVGSNQIPNPCDDQACTVGCRLIKNIADSAGEQVKSSCDDREQTECEEQSTDDFVVNCEEEGSSDADADACKNTLDP